MSRTVFLIIGPSGSGKTSLTQSLVERVPQLTKGITATTRVPRPGEVSGKDYHFVTHLQFLQMQREGAFLETDFASITRVMVYPAQHSMLKATSLSSLPWQAHSH
ncbi:hypothetical protein [Edaphobacter aggregans]|uniref:hypothetical protein n=1 Tax=Edaphobacter aggregans TaxID=570835 RepID=UPI00068B1BF8